jgi:NAD(P)H dehydrogenase (quinone)
MLAQSGLSHVTLRNNWYLENYDIPLALEHGLFGAAGNGRICAAPRADYAEAAATMLTQSGHEGSVHELGGAGFTLTELAAEIARQSGRPVTYTDLTPEKYTELLVGFGVPEGYAAMLADADRAAAGGALDVPKTGLETLLGHPATPLSEAIGKILAK